MEKKILKNFREGKQKLEIIPKQGNVMDQCASLDDRYICCNTYVIKTVSNCPFECTYCFLQNYLNNTTMSLIGDIPAVMEEVRENLNKEPWRFFRIGNWELGDSLALEDKVNQAETLINHFASLNQAILDLRTKGDNVDSLLNLDHKGRTVIGWTLSPDSIIKKEELKTASLKNRIEAMAKTVNAGYLTAFHFDPMLYHKNWENNYTKMIDAIFEKIPVEKIAWISIGSMRFNPEMKKILENNYPGSKLTSAELILGDDHKMRYVKPLRAKMYKTLYDAIIKNGGKEIHTYLCMERWDMWDKILGYHPDSIGHHDYFFTQSLFNRFPNLVHQKPDRNLYDPKDAE